VSVGLDAIDSVKVTTEIRVCLGTETEMYLMSPKSLAYSSKMKNHDGKAHAFRYTSLRSVRLGILLDILSGTYS
jgi:hypothetical protein